MKVDFFGLKSADLSPKKSLQVAAETLVATIAGLLAPSTSTVTGRMEELAELGCPILAAVSNEDFIGEAIGELRTEDRLEGSLVTTVACVLHGARLVRAHDVRPTVRAVRMTEVLLGMVLLGMAPPGLALHNVV